MKPLPSKNRDYGTKDYWNTRYAKEESYEWCHGFNSFKHLITPHLKSSDRVLNLGCGNSKLGLQIHDLGISDVTNLDYSAVVIDRMQDEFATSYPNLKWVALDMRDMVLSLPNDATGPPVKKDDNKLMAGSFDVIIEKGTLDVFFVQEKSPWSCSEETQRNVDATLSCISKLLKPKGIFLSLTFTQPHFRKPFYENPKYGWQVDTFTYGDTFHYFLYVVTKIHKS